jgi:hypothetical protein
MNPDRNADGQFPKQFHHERTILHEMLGYTKDEAEALVDRWNLLHEEKVNVSGFLQLADLQFTKHELLYLFTMSTSQKNAET